MNWTHISDPDEAARLFPTWLGRRLVGLRGAFGLLLTSGDVMRITSITAVHHASDGVILLDVALDSAGVPEGVDLAWRSKHFLGAPVPGATMATVNLANVTAVVEFSAAVTAESPPVEETSTADEVVMELERIASQDQSAVEVGDSEVSQAADDTALTMAVDESLRKKKKRKK